MMSKLIQKHFGKKDLYSIFQVEKNSTPSAIKQAYKSLALKYHPDKNLGDDKATEKFQALGMIHSILGSPEKRELYDTLGQLDFDDDHCSSDFSWYNYWRELFPKVSTQDIMNFESKYKNSTEEKEDVLQAYELHQGDMLKILDTVILASEGKEDEDRFRKIIQTAIDNDQVKDYAKFHKKISLATKKKRSIKREKEANEAKELLDLIKQKNSTNALSHREQEFNSMISNLESKYAKKKKKINPRDPPTEDEFQKIQKKLDSKKKKK